MFNSFLCCSLFNSFLYGSPTTVNDDPVSLDESDGSVVRKSERSPSFAQNPEDILLFEEKQAAVRNFVDSLPKDEQKIVQGVFWNDQSLSLVGAKLGVSKVAIFKRLQRIFRKGQGNALLGEFQN